MATYIARGVLYSMIHKVVGGSMIHFCDGKDDEPHRATDGIAVTVTAAGQLEEHERDFPAAAEAWPDMT